MPTQRPRTARLRARQAPRARAAGVQPAVHIRVGHPAEQIIAAAEEWEADLIVTGHRGKGLFERWLLGSVSRVIIAYPLRRDGDSMSPSGTARPVQHTAASVRASDDRPSAVRTSKTVHEGANERADAAPLGIRRLSWLLSRRLLAGEHLLLWGPTGSGKTTLLMAIESQVRGRPCARTLQTRSLDDITCALERAYPGVATRGMSRRTARGRLWRAADREPVVLLLDDVGHVGTAMKGFLRRLRGGIAGVMLAADVDSPRERARLREQHLGYQTLRMPPLAGKAQRVLLTTQWAACELPALPLAVGRQLIRAAHGRPGWIVMCAELARDPVYWRGNTVKPALLALDTELRLRASKRALVGIARGSGLSAPAH